MNLPDLKFEQSVWTKGFRIVGGCDEVGRGSFAGPIVAATCVFEQNSNFKIPQFQKKLDAVSNEFTNKVIINDSKRLSEKQREKASKWVKENAMSWGIGEASTAIINRLGMAKATKIAFRRAVVNANLRLIVSNLKLEYLLIDAFYLPFVKGIRRKNQQAIVKGDAKSFSIAAASIIAKVYRDSLMNKIGSRRQYKKYGWVKNKGYGTKIHQEAILKHGISVYHRRMFVETFLSKRNRNQ